MKLCKLKALRFVKICTYLTKRKVTKNISPLLSFSPSFLIIMKSTCVFLLLQVLMIAYCFAEEGSDMPAANSDLDMHEAQQSPNTGNVQNMWAMVRQSLGNLGSSIKPASTDDKASTDDTISPAQDGDPTTNQTITAEDILLEKDSREINELVLREDHEEEEDTNDEDLPRQLVPIEKGLVYLRPKEDERWILNEEG